MPATYEKIATTTLGSASASITFSSIPATYTDLRLVLLQTGSSTVRLPRFYFNTDTATNYSATTIAADGTTASSFRQTNDNRVRFAQTYNVSNTVPTFYTADIFSYAGSTFKSVLCTASADANGSGSVEMDVNLWRSTAAINQIVLDFGSATTFNTGTTATLYGILKA